MIKTPSRLLFPLFVAYFTAIIVYYYRLSIANSIVNRDSARKSNNNNFIKVLFATSAIADLCSYPLCATIPNDCS